LHRSKTSRSVKRFAGYGYCPTFLIFVTPLFLKIFPEFEFGGNKKLLFTIWIFEMKRKNPLRLEKAPNRKDGKK
jgi:hypothetical protein